MSGPRTQAIGRAIDRISGWLAAVAIVSSVVATLFAVGWGLYAVAFLGVSPWFLLVVAFGAFWLWKVALPAIRA